MAVSSMSQILPLELLRRGERGVVNVLTGDDSLIHRLAEMGLRQGVSFTMLQPGCPCILCVGEHRLTLRLDPSLQILVDVTY